MFAIGNVIVAVFTAIHRYSSYPERIEQHKKTSDEYTKIYREIYMELTLPSSNLVAFSRDVLSRYDKLNHDAPDVPQCIVKEFNKRFPTLIHRPDLCNGLFDLEQRNCTQFDVDSKTAPYIVRDNESSSKQENSIDLQRIPMSPNRQPFVTSIDLQRIPMSPNRHNTSLVYFPGQSNFQSLDLNHSNIESKSNLYFVHSI